LGHFPLFFAPRTSGGLPASIRSSLGTYPFFWSLVKLSPSLRQVLFLELNFVFRRAALSLQGFVVPPPSSPSEGRFLAVVGFFFHHSPPRQVFPLRAIPPTATPKQGWTLFLSPFLSLIGKASPVLRFAQWSPSPLCQSGLTHPPARLTKTV